MLSGMSVHGALSTMPAEDVLEWAARRKLSAPLTFEHDSTIRGLVIEDGLIVWASSTDPWTKAWSRQVFLMAGIQN